MKIVERFELYDRPVEAIFECEAVDRGSAWVVELNFLIDGVNFHSEKSVIHRHPEEHCYRRALDVYRAFSLAFTFEVFKKIWVEKLEKSQCQIQK